MAYLSPSLVRYSNIGDAKGVSILQPMDRPDDVLLIGVGDQPYAWFLGGEWAGQGFLLSTAEDWSGTMISNVEVEVDVTSAYDPQGGKKPLSIVQRGDQLGMFFKLENSHFPQTVTGLLKVGPDGAPSSSPARLGFSRWRLFVRDGEDKVLVHEHLG